MTVCTGADLQEEDHPAMPVAIGLNGPQARAERPESARLGSCRRNQPPESWIQIVFVSVYWSWAWSDLSWPPKPDSL